MSVAEAFESGRAVFEDPDEETRFEPRTFAEGEAAVRAFREGFEGSAKTMRKATERSRMGASSLSEDPLQGLSEVIQNADDRGASFVRISHTDAAVTFTHDGEPAHLKNIHAISLPWLTTNQDNSETTGRFGIGLSTLQSLSDHFEFNSGPYRIRVGAPYLSWVGDADDSAPTDHLTSLRVPLDSSTVAGNQFERWVQSWSDDGLMFLRSVRAVEFESGGNSTRLSLTTETQARRSTPSELEVSRVSASDGRSWMVYRQQTDTPLGLTRKSKKTANVVNIGVAFPLTPTTAGTIYAGLPVEDFPYPVLVNAPLDPTTSRRGFLHNDWNDRLVDLIATTWELGLGDMFLSHPAGAWAHVPTTEETGLGLSRCTNALASRMFERSRTIVQRLSVVIDGVAHGLGDVVAELPALRGLIDDDATHRLLGAPWLPLEHRDDNGRWLEVWEHWVDARQPLHGLIDASSAAPLLDSPERPDEWIILLHAAVIAEDEYLSIGEPCIVTSTGARVPMPDYDDVAAFSLSHSEGLGHSLGVTTNLSDLYSSSPGGDVVLDHLRQLDRLLDEHSAKALLTHLSRLGREGDVDPIQVSDEQLREIRESVEAMGREFLNEIGAGLGAAIAIECANGVGESRRTNWVSPAKAYLGRPFITDARSWGVAATMEVGWWVEPRYEAILQSDLPREHAIGARRFLTGLGASVYARIEPVTQFDKMYSGSPSGGTSAYGHSAARTQALLAMNADHTLDDTKSQHLVAAAQGIAQEGDPVVRRRRAASLLDSLRAGWRNNYEGVSRTRAVMAYHEWHRRGETRALWLWRLADIAWMDDSNGNPARPASLKLRTPSNVAIHGSDPSALVHPELEEVGGQVLRELGVAGEPRPDELVAALAELRDLGEVTPEVLHACLALYSAIGDWITSPDAALGERTRIREAFIEQSLVFTGDTWVRAEDAFRGQPIFRSFRHFAPPGAASVEALWTAIPLRLPNALDCVKVLTEIAEAGPLQDRDVPTVVEVLRYVESPTAPEVTSHAARKWKALPLWTGDGWVPKRPVFSTDNSILARALSDQVAVWQPRAHVGQFSQALDLMGLTAIDESAVTVEANATFDPDATDKFRATVSALHEDLVLNDETMHRSLKSTWDELSNVNVHFCDRIDAQTTLGKRTVKTEVNAWLDRPTSRLLIRHGTSIGDSADVASAVGAWFSTSSRHAEDAWYRAVRALEASGNRTSGGTGLAVRASTEISEQRRRANIEGSANALAGLRSQVGTTPKKSMRKSTPSTPTTSTDTAGVEENRGPTVASSRHLIDPAGWVFDDLDPEVLEAERPKAPRTRAATGMREPTAGASPTLSGGAAHRAYTDQERESVGLELVRRIIESDDNRLHDLRDQYGVGADAMDDMRRFFELKVSGGAEPDTVTLEASQVERALSTPNFFLVVVSGVEQGAADVKVRFIHKPTESLTVTSKTKLEFSGVRRSTSMIFSATPLMSDVEGPSQDDELRP